MIEYTLVIDAENILKMGNLNISIQQPSKSKSQMEIENLKGLVIWRSGDLGRTFHRELT